MKVTDHNVEQFVSEIAYMDGYDKCINADK